MLAKPSILIAAGFLMFAGHQGWATKLGLQDLSTWTIAEGLPQSTVNSVLQTSDGYIWVATFGGLARFDGVRFESFDLASTNGALGNRILALHEDREGNLLIGGDRLTCYRDGTFEKIELPSQTAEVSSFAEDDAGTVWLSSRLGLFTIQGTQAIRMDLPGFEDSRLTSVVYFDSSKRLWVGGRGLARLDASGPQSRNRRSESDRLPGYSSCRATYRQRLHEPGTSVQMRPSLRNRSLRECSKTLCAKCSAHGRRVR